MEDRVENPRIGHEKKTVDAMIRLYCREKHERDDELCSECKELYDYAMLCLTNYPF